MAHLIAIAGPNGAGKSSTAPALLRDLFELDNFVNADVLAQEISPMESTAAVLAAGRAVLREMDRLARSGVDFAFESTLASRSLAPWVRSLCTERGYAFHLIYLWLPSPALAAARVARRVAMGGHDVPPEVVRRRFYRSLKNLFELYQPLAESWHYYDNSSVTGVPRLISAGNGRNTVAVYDEEVLRAMQEAGHGSTR
jgi:predicted ABC-type ATPase